MLAAASKMCAVGGAGQGMPGKKKKRGEGWSGAEIFPTLGSAKVKVADKDICQGSVRQQRAKKKALSPHRGQAKPLLSGLGKTASYLSF